MGITKVLPLTGSHGENVTVIVVVDEQIQFDLGISRQPLPACSLLPEIREIPETTPIIEQHDRPDG